MIGVGGVGVFMSCSAVEASFSLHFCGHTNGRLDDVHGGHLTIQLALELALDCAEVLVGCAVQRQRDLGRPFQREARHSFPPSSCVLRKSLRVPG